MALCIPMPTFNTSFINSSGAYIRSLNLSKPPTCVSAEVPFFIVIKRLLGGCLKKEVERLLPCLAQVMLFGLHVAAPHIYLLNLC